MKDSRWQNDYQIAKVGENAAGQIGAETWHRSGTRF